MDRVTLRGLKNAKHLNKKQAVVLEEIEGKPRWHVFLIEEKKQLSVHRKNLRKSNLFKEANNEVRNLVSSILQPPRSGPKIKPIYTVEPLRVNIPSVFENNEPSACLGGFYVSLEPWDMGNSYEDHGRICCSVLHFLQHPDDKEWWFMERTCSIEEPRYYNEKEVMFKDFFEAIIDEFQTNIVNPEDDGEYEFVTPEMKFAFINNGWTMNRKKRSGHTSASLKEERDYSHLPYTKDVNKSMRFALKTKPLGNFDVMNFGFFSNDAGYYAEESWIDILTDAAERGTLGLCEVEGEVHQHEMMVEWSSGKREAIPHRHIYNYNRIYHGHGYEGFYGVFEAQKFANMDFDFDPEVRDAIVDFLGGDKMARANVGSIVNFLLDCVGNDDIWYKYIGAADSSCKFCLDVHCELDPYVSYV